MGKAIVKVRTSACFGSFISFQYADSAVDMFFHYTRLHGSELQSLTIFMVFTRSFCQFGCKPNNTTTSLTISVQFWLLVHTKSLSKNTKYRSNVEMPTQIIQIIICSKLFSLPLHSLSRTPKSGSSYNNDWSHTIKWIVQFCFENEFTVDRLFWTSEYTFLKNSFHQFQLTFNLLSETPKIGSFTIT